MGEINYKELLAKYIDQVAAYEGYDLIFVFIVSVLIGFFML